MSTGKRSSIPKDASPEEKIKLKKINDRKRLIKRMGIDPDNQWEADWQIIPDKEKVLKALKKAAKSAEHIYLATYLIAGAVQVLNLFVLAFLNIPKPKKNINIRRPLSEILLKKELILAILSAALGFSLMSFIMTATPIQIVNICKLGNDVNANIIQWLSLIHI